MFNGFNGTNIDISNLDLSNIVRAEYLFNNCTNLKKIDLSVFKNAKKLHDIYFMFGNCSSLTSVDLSGINLIGYEYGGYDCGRLFHGCKNLNCIDLTDLGLNEQGRNDNHFMLLNCINLKYCILNSKNYKDNPIMQYTMASETYNFEIYSETDSNFYNTPTFLIPEDCLEEANKHAEYYMGDSYYYSGPEIDNPKKKFDSIENYIITRSDGEITVVHK